LEDEDEDSDAESEAETDMMVLDPDHVSHFICQLAATYTFNFR
jgi:hypothetical protein